ncbi:hypothetical protein PAXINDRAFT_70520, partial [Paxillus involutus ATCC 200175]
ASREFESDPEFRAFCRQLFHSSLEAILEPMCSSMTKPEITKCADGHYRRAIYDIGPYIADYPEQALLACIVQGWCSKCTAHRDHLDEDENVTPRTHDHTKLLMQSFTSNILWQEYGIVDDILLIAPDILHQIIKGTFKDHLVAWVEKYFKHTYGKCRAEEIMADIGRR